MAKFTKLKGGRRDDRQEYREKIRRYNRRNFYRGMLGLAVVFVFCIIIYLQYLSHFYTGYEVRSSVEVDEAIVSKQTSLGKSILSYSQDGAHLTDVNGTVIWNQTYQIQDLKVAKNGGTVAFANYNGRDIYVLNEKGSLGNFQTNLPIRQIAVSETGTVTAVLADTDVTWINTYDPDGTMKLQGQAHMSRSGYPAVVALSPSGKLLQISYVYVDAGTVKTTIAFYNFGSAGDNYSDNLVSGYDYTDLVAPEIGFLSDSAAYAVGDGRLMIYQGEERPAIKQEYLFDDEVRSVFSGNGYVGIVFASDKQGSRYRFEVYGADGSLKGKYYFDLDYSEIIFDKKNFIIYNDSECLIETLDGRVKYNGGFDTSVKVIIPTDSAYRYVIVTGNSIDTIQLN